jgi:choline dehydrogenase-like flavoprotein
VIEGGGPAAQDALEDTYRAEVSGFPHKGVHEGRFRALGGTTTRWGGQLWPWEPYEFEPRDWVPGPGWPIGYDEVAPHYPPALALLNVDSEYFYRDTWPSRGVKLPALDPGLFTYKFSKWAAWRHRNMGRTLGRRLARTPDVEIRLHTTALEFIVDPAGVRVEGVRCRTAEGGEERVQARTYVLCGGTIENARLLLSSGSVVPEGLGNHADHVGRGFMDHLSARVATFVPHDPSAFAHAFAPFYVDGVMHTPRMVLAPEVQAEEKLLACYGHWTLSLPDDSGLALLRDGLRGLQAGRGLGLSVGQLRSALGSARDMVRLAVGYALSKRRYFPRDAVVHLQIDTEQVPSFTSRVRLGKGHDALGLPRTVLEWDVSDAERRTIRRCAELFAGELERLELGTVEWASTFTSSDPVWTDLISDAYHPMGGTRMSAAPEDGVVDPNSRVHGTDNLFVAGASVFPTGGMANPTLTLLALALRLGDHLHERLRA